MGLTSDQILALAPDSASAVAGRGLANAAKWGNLGADSRSLWGECKGSGAKPYQAQVDLSGPAFKCSCPSRKFPCKHGLGLYLIYAAKPDIFTGTDAPAWVAEWLKMRDEREGKRPAAGAPATLVPSAATDGEAAPNQDSADAGAEPAAAKSLADPDAQAKRVAERERKVEAGIGELELWMQDLMRGGLVMARSQGYRYFDAMAARLVDAQASGLARLVRQLGSDAVAADWQDALLGGLGRLQLVCDAYHRRTILSPDVAEDARGAIGWTLREETLLEAAGVRDRWFVAGTRVTEEDNLRVGRTWLFGSATGQRALLLQFAHGGRAPEMPFAGGQWLEAELVFYPGNLPSRAVVRKAEMADPTVAASLPLPGGSVAEACRQRAQALARLPWSSGWPVAVGPVHLMPAGGTWRARDAAGDELLVRGADQGLWKLLAISGGESVTVFGVLEGEALTLCGAHHATADAGNVPNGGGFVAV